LEKADISRGLAVYNAKEYVQKVQEFYDKAYPGRYRIFVFDDAGYYKPTRASKVETYETALPIYTAMGTFTV